MIGRLATCVAGIALVVTAACGGKKNPEEASPEKPAEAGFEIDLFEDFGAGFALAESFPDRVRFDCDFVHNRGRVCRRGNGMSE